MANQSRLGRDLAVELAVVASAATPDAAADSDSSVQPTVKRVVPAPHSRYSKVTAVPSDSSHELYVTAHPTIPNTNDQGSATMFRECIRSVRAECFHDNK